MIQENLVAEHIAIESYREMLVYMDEKDLRTRRILGELLAREEVHVDDLVSLLAGVKDREMRVSAGPAPQLRDPRPAGVVEYRDSRDYERGSTAKAGYQTGGESRR
jgi:rubrerythrin